MKINSWLIVTLSFVTVYPSLFLKYYDMTEVAPTLTG